MTAWEVEKLSIPWIEIWSPELWRHVVRYTGTNILKNAMYHLHIQGRTPFLLNRKWRQRVPLKRWFLFTPPCCITSWKTITLRLNPDESLKSHLFSWIWSSHGSYYEQHCLLRCNTVQPEESLLNSAWFLPTVCFPYSSSLNMEVVWSFETLVNVYHTYMV